MVVQADARVTGRRYLLNQLLQLSFGAAGFPQVQAVEAVVEELSQYFGFIGQKFRSCEDKEMHFFKIYTYYTCPKNGREDLVLGRRAIAWLLG